MLPENYPVINGSQEAEGQEKNMLFLAHFERGDCKVTARVIFLVLYIYSPEVRNEPKIACFFPAVRAVVHVGA